MKLRKRKKAYDCSHHVYEDFLVTDDPYPIHNTEDYCKLGKYDNTWSAPEKKVNICEHCNRFCASRPMIRKQREATSFAISHLMILHIKYSNEWNNERFYI